MNRELPDVQLDLEKAGELEIKLSTSKKQENTGKAPTSALLAMPKPLTV